MIVAADTTYSKHGLIFFWLDKFGSTDEESIVVSDSEEKTTNVGSKYKDLEVTVENGVQKIRMNRPTKYNAITWEVKFASISKRTVFSLSTLKDLKLLP